MKNANKTTKYLYNFPFYIIQVVIIIIGAILLFIYLYQTKTQQIKNNNLLIVGLSILISGLSLYFYLHIRDEDMIKKYYSEKRK